MGRRVQSECGRGHGPENYVRDGRHTRCIVSGRERYEAMVSSRHHPDHQRRFWIHVDKRGPDECWPWIGPRLKGYGIYRGTPSNRYALELSLGRRLDAGQHAAHQCDNPICVNPAHLFEATPKENSEDAVRKGRWAFGARNGRTRNRNAGLPQPALTENRVQIVRLALDEGYRGSDIAAFLGISQAAVSRIRHGSRHSQLATERSAA